MNEIYHHSEHNIISRMIRVRCEILELIQHLHINKNCIFSLYRVFFSVFFLILNFHNYTVKDDVLLYLHRTLHTSCQVPKRHTYTLPRF